VLLTRFISRPALSGLYQPHSVTIFFYAPKIFISVTNKYEWRFAKTITFVVLFVDDKISLLEERKSGNSIPAVSIFYSSILFFLERGSFDDWDSADVLLGIFASDANRT
jgi:hypothetical protein